MSRWKAAVQVLLGVALLSLLLTRIDGREVLQVVRNGRPGYLLLGLLCVPLLVWLQSLRLHLLIGSVTGRQSETFRLVLQGFFFNQFLPSAVGGDGYKVVYLKRHSQSWKRSMALVTLDRAAGLAVILTGGFLYLVLPGSAGAPLVPDTSWLDPSPWWFPAAGLAILLGIRIRHRVRRLAARLGERGWNASTAARRSVPLLLLATLALASRVYRIHFFLLGLHGSAHPWDLVYVMFLTNLAMLLPLTVGGLGVQEGVLAYALSGYGVPLAMGAAVALFNRLAVWLVSLAGGLLFAGTGMRETDSRPPGPSAGGRPTP